jgi:hypothetical protein
VRIRPAVSASSINTGRWATSTSLPRPSAYTMQPELTYRVGQAFLTAIWASPGKEVHLEAQLISTHTYTKASSPVGALVKATYRSATEPIRVDLTFGGQLGMGEVHVRFRQLPPANEKGLPGEWMTSTKSLIRLGPPINNSESSYILGEFKGRFHDADYNSGVTQGSTLEMYLTTSERGVTNPVYTARAQGRLVEFIVKPENAPSGDYIRVARVIGKDDCFITSELSSASQVSLLAKPRLTLSSPTTVSWNKIEGVAYYVCAIWDVKYPGRDFSRIVDPSPAPSLDVRSQNLGPGTYRVLVTPNGRQTSSWTGPQSDPVDVTIT